jgi:hypothetical protein
MRGIAGPGLTEFEKRNGSRWLIVGTRRDGSRLVIDQTSDLDRARRMRATFRSFLEGYAAVEIEDCLREASAVDDEE